MKARAAISTLLAVADVAIGAGCGDADSGGLD